MGSREAEVPFALGHEFTQAHSEGYLLLTRSNSLITWSVRSIVSLL